LGSNYFVFTSVGTNRLTKAKCEVTATQKEHYAQLSHISARNKSCVDKIKHFLHMKGKTIQNEEALGNSRHSTPTSIKVQVETIH